jgi:hypothetical protein
MLKIVCSILSRNESLVFREPVDHVGLGLDDYPLIVTKPMDLGTVKKKIENDEYNAVEDIAADIRLVWSNCMLYNRDGSEVRFLLLSLAPFPSHAAAFPSAPARSSVLPPRRHLCPRLRGVVRRAAEVRQGPAFTPLLYAPIYGWMLTLTSTPPPTPVQAREQQQ